MHFRLKPVIGATYQTLKDKLQGLGKDIQAADTSDLEYEAIKKQVRPLPLSLSAFVLGCLPRPLTRPPTPCPRTPRDTRAHPPLA